MLIPVSSNSYSTYGIMSGNPSKKIRLDFQGDGSAGNEDLWGQDDLTAEEFDMLEIQATQSCNQNHVQGNCTSHQQNNLSEIDETKQHQYELEGRVKLLSQSLEKSVKELSEERSNRERIINDRIKELNARETDLQKEIERMRSILEFKDQEMKSTCSKVQVLKSQLQDRKNSNAETSLNKNFEVFLKSSKSDSREESFCLKSPKSFSRRYKLSTDTPKGETKGIDALSSILCTRLSIPKLWSLENTVNYAHLENSSSNYDFTSISVLLLKNEQKSDELLEHYKSVLKRHVVELKASKNNLTSSGKTSPIAVKQKEVDSYTVISFLRDIAYLLPLFKKYHFKKENNRQDRQSEMNGDEYSDNVSHDQDNGNSTTCNLAEVLELLITLADPKTYPTGYPKNEEIEYSLSALLSICQTYPDKFMSSGFELPIHCFINPHLSVTALCTTLKLLTALCSYKSFVSYLIHKNNNCMLCLIATFLVGIVPYYPDKFSSSVIFVEDFLSSVFSVHGILEISLETSPCISEIIQGIIKSVWKYYQLKENSNPDIQQVIKKGFILLHTLSSCIPNFKDKRSSVEDEYISLVTSILALSKDNTEFKEFYDLIHSLWDFQTDTTEFDIEDIPEETQALANEADAIE